MSEPAPLAAEGAKAYAVGDAPVAIEDLVAAALVGQREVSCRGEAQTALADALELAAEP